MKRITYSDKNEWQDKVGYCRAKKVGTHILISGTVANDENGNPIGIGNIGLQTRAIIDTFDTVLKHFGYDLSSVVRTRIFTTDISKWNEIGELHGEYFKDIKPVTTMVEVSKLISPDYLVEIEAEAIVED